MPADCLNDVFVEVTRVAHQAGHVVGVPKTFENSILERSLASLSKLQLLCRCVIVKVSDPKVVSCSCLLGNMLLEDDHV